MRGSFVVALAGLATIGAGAASATPNLEIKQAVARVTIIPEARGDIVVTVTNANSRLPLKITRMGNSGCGDWTVADQTGPLHVHVSGSGDVSVGR